MGETLLGHTPRDVKVFVAYFRVPKDTIGEKSLRSKIENLTGSAEIRSFRVKDEVATLELTPTGRENLSKSAKARGSTISKLIKSMVSGRLS